MRQPSVRHWTPGHVSVSHTSGPQVHREADASDPPYEPPSVRLGFAAPGIREVEPLLWEGDQA